MNGDRNGGRSSVRYTQTAVASPIKLMNDEKKLPSIKTPRTPEEQFLWPALKYLWPVLLVSLVTGIVALYWFVGKPMGCSASRLNRNLPSCRGGFLCCSCSQVSFDPHPTS